MEALSALGVAAAVVQFVDITTRLCVSAEEIFHSSSGLSAENAEIEEIYGLLAKLSLRLEHESSTIHPAGATEAGSLHGVSDPRLAALLKVAFKCRTDCDAILKAVRDASAPNGKEKVWKSAKGAVKSVLGRRKIAELERAVSRTQDAMSTHVQSILRYLTQICRIPSFRVIDAESPQ